MMLQLYLHIPFCKQKCFYCDFCSETASYTQMNTYISALQKEIVQIRSTWPEADISTVYIGGGTPSILPVELWKQLLYTLQKAFPLNDDVEFTSEANPGTLTDEWLDTAVKYGINRISLGVQAIQPHLLQTLGRIHTFSQSQLAVQMLRKHGIHNINLDIMAGLPSQRPEDYMETLQSVVELDPTHLSAYDLIVEEGTPLSAGIREGRICLPSEEDVADMTESGAEWLTSQGYLQYEISNYSKPGYECKHNLGYWQGAWYAGMGIAAHSLLPTTQQDFAYIRLANTTEQDCYVQSLQKGESPPFTSSYISPEEACFETMVLRLRTIFGISEKDFLKLHGIPLCEKYGASLESLIHDNLGEWIPAVKKSSNRTFRLTKKGLRLQNQALLRFMG